MERYDLCQTIPIVVIDHHDLGQLGLIGVRVSPTEVCHEYPTALFELLVAVLEGKHVGPCQLEG